MDASPKNIEENLLPELFRSILWSYDFSKMDPEKNKKIIIIQAINYGNLKHWSWIINHYGLPSIKQILMSVPVSEIKHRTRKLISIMFSIENFNYVPRSADQ